MRCFSSPGSLRRPMDSVGDDPKGPGFPIRKSADQRALAPPRGLSQRATSFIASQCQGIHQMPLLRLIRSRSQGPGIAIQGSGTETVGIPKPRSFPCSHLPFGVTLSTSSLPAVRIQSRRRPRACAPGPARLMTRRPTTSPIHDVKERKSKNQEIGKPSPAGGADRDRTGNLLLAKQALSQLSYGPDRAVGDRPAADRWRLIGGPGRT